MNAGKTSRRQFVQLAGGLTLALRHGLLPAQAAASDNSPPDTGASPHAAPHSAPRAAGTATL